MTEKQLQTYVLELARALGWLVYHPYDSRRSQEGFPDLVLVRNKRLLFVELKSARGKVSDAQKKWIAALTETGTDVHIWRPEDWSNRTIERCLLGTASKEVL